MALLTGSEPAHALYARFPSRTAACRHAVRTISSSSIWMSGVWSLRIPARLKTNRPFLLIVRTGRIFTAHTMRASSAGYSEFPAYSRMHTAPSPARGAAFYLRHFVTPQLALSGWVVSVPPSSPRRRGGRTISSPADRASGVWPLGIPTRSFRAGLSC